MKSFIVPAFISFFFLLTSNTIAQTSGMGYVNITFIYQTLPDIKQAQVDLNTIEEQKRNELNTKEKQIKDKIATYQQGSTSVTPAMVEAVNKEKAELIKIATAKDEEMNNKKQVLYKNIDDKIKKAIQAVALRNGYSGVMDVSTLVYYDKEDDISKLVLKELGVTTE